VSARLSDIITPRQVAVGFESPEKLGVVKRITGLLESSGEVTDSVSLFQAMMIREELQSTVINGGSAVDAPEIHVAIPHAKTDAVRCLTAAVGIARDGVDFGSEDGSPIHLIVALAAPRQADGVYIRTLRRIAELLLLPGFKQALLDCATPEQAIDTVQRFEALLDTNAAPTSPAVAG